MQNENEEVQENPNMTVRCISDVAFIEEIFSPPDTQIDNFGANSPPTITVDQAGTSTTANQNNKDILESPIRDIVVPEIHIEPPRETLFRPQLLDFASTSMESTFPRNWNRPVRTPKTHDCNVLPVIYMENRRPDVETHHRSFEENFINIENDKDHTHNIKSLFMTPTRLSPDFSMGLNVQDKLRTLTEKFIETIEYRDIDNNQNRDEKAITKLNQNDPQTGSPASILPYISSNKNILDPDMIHPEDEFEPSIDLSHEPNMIFTAVLDRLTPPSILEDRAKDNEEMNSILSANWDPLPLLKKIIELEFEGETNIDLEKIVSKDTEPLSLVTPRRALAKAFTSLFVLEHKGYVRVERKADSNKIRHISLNVKVTDEA